MAAKSGTVARPRAPRRARNRGQSLVEFSLVLPVLLAIVGVVIDASRLFQAWTDLESATRDAAQYLARSDTDPLSVDYTVEGPDSDKKAMFVLESATKRTFSRAPTQGQQLTTCDKPTVTTIFTASTALANGGSAANPVGTATVKTCIPFKTIFPYPILTTNGAFILRSERQVTIIIGR